MKDAFVYKLHSFLSVAAGVGALLFLSEDNIIVFAALLVALYALIDAQRRALAVTLHTEKARFLALSALVLTTVGAASLSLRGLPAFMIPALSLTLTCESHLKKPLAWISLAASLAFLGIGYAVSGWNAELARAVLSAFSMVPLVAFIAVMIVRASNPKASSTLLKMLPSALLRVAPLPAALLACGIADKNLLMPPVRPVFFISCALCPAFTGALLPAFRTSAREESLKRTALACVLFIAGGLAAIFPSFTPASATVAAIWPAFLAVGLLQLVSMSVNWIHLIDAVILSVAALACPLLFGASPETQSRLLFAAGCLHILGCFDAFRESRLLLRAWKLKRKYDSSSSGRGPKPSI